MAPSPSPGSGPAGRVIVVTGDVETTPDEYVAVRNHFLALTGKNRERLVHVTLDAKTLNSSRRYQEAIAGLALDTSVRCLVLSPAQSGASRALRAVRERVPELPVICVNDTEDPLTLAATSTAVLAQDAVCRAANLRASMAAMSVNLLVLVLPDEDSRTVYQARFSRVARKALENAGITLWEYSRADLAGGKVDDAINGLSAPAWVWVGSGLLDGARIRKWSANKNVLLETEDSSLAGMLSPVDARTGGAEAWDCQKALKQVEKTAIAEGWAGRLATTIYPPRYTLTLAVLSALQNAGATALPASITYDKYLRAVDKACNSTGFSFSHEIDSDTGVRSRNSFVFMEDLYLIGKGFVSRAQRKVAEPWYFTQ